MGMLHKVVKLIFTTVFLFSIDLKTMEIED